MCVLNGGELARNSDAKALVGRRRFFDLFKRTKIYVLPFTVLRHSNPSFIVSAPMNAGKAGLTFGRDAVDLVLATGRLAKIIQPIVRRIAINVINLKSRETPIHVKPDEPMSQIDTMVDMQVSPAAPISRTSDSTDPTALPFANFQPNKISSVRVIPKHSAEFGLGDVGFRHISFHAALVLNKLQNKLELEGRDETKNGVVRDDANGSAEQAGKKNPEADYEYVTHRLKEIEAWERRIKGNAPR